MKLDRKFLTTLFFCLFYLTSVFAIDFKKSDIKIIGNKSISKETILNYIDSKKDILSTEDLNSFQKKLFEGMDKIHKNLTLSKHFFLSDAWGIKINKGNQTKYHDHLEGSRYSGILYLNDSEQNLNFPELKIYIKPQEGHFVLFSSILIHGTEVNISDSPKYAIAFNTKINPDN